MMSFTDWLLADLRLPKGIHSEAEAEHPWWRVMCLTGVDYFSTLGYQPGIAFLAAGILSPVATFVLVLVTLFGALPVYSRVAEASPGGQGSIAMLEKLFPDWTGKLFVLCLLGFATTDFVITMTLSAADAAAHFTQNPFTPNGMKSQMTVTLVLLVILGAIFLKGFKEAIGVAVVLVGIYLSLNLVVTLDALYQLSLHADSIAKWRDALFTEHGNALAVIGLSLVLFPKLALGLSGFETGVAVMPLIAGEDLNGRIRNTRKLLKTAAIIMSIFLLATSMATTLLIEPEKFKEGGEANGRALAYLAHKYLGDGFGTVYDVSTILILAFAGASAMAGLLNLIPRYLPRFGMAPEWARGIRPLVLVFLGVAVTVTVLFQANVDAQGGAYATGVLVLITTAAVAVTISVWQRPTLRWLFFLITTVFAYTTVVNIYERPEGLKISSIFIATIVFVSIFSRALRSTELRITEVQVDDNAKALLALDEDQVVHLVAHRPRIRREETAGALDVIDREVRRFHGLKPEERVYIFEVEPRDTSEFTECLRVSAECVGRHVILKAASHGIANAIAAMLIHLEETTGQVPHAYFQWTEGNPIGNIFKFLFFGQGDVAPITHEVLRRAVKDAARRPVIHVA
jgi:hypothetical protein